MQYNSTHLASIWIHGVFCGFVMALIIFGV